MSSVPRIAVVGLGNAIMGDDGVGPRVIAALHEMEVPPNVELLDLGTPGLGLTPYITGYDVVIFIDAVRDSASPGSVKTYSREQILAMPGKPRLSPHDPAVKDALLLADLEGSAPRDALLVGVIPEDCTMRVGLTSAVEAAIPEAVRSVQTAIGTLMPAARASNCSSMYSSVRAIAQDDHAGENTHLSGAC